MYQKNPGKYVTAELGWSLTSYVAQAWIFALGLVIY